MPEILLALDVEEFDIPCEYGMAVPFETQIEVSSRGLTRAMDALKAKGATITMFTTARYAEARPDLVRAAAQAGHEIASHGLTHSTWGPDHLLRSREILESIAGTPVRGFRRARMGATPAADLASAGYAYDSSENPTWLPGRYNNFSMPRLPRMDGEVLRIPASVSPRWRFPLFWLAFKNAPWWLYRAAAQRALTADGFLNLYFHPWEFSALADYALPGYVRRPDGEALLKRFATLIDWLKARGTFTRFSEFDRSWRMTHATPAGTTAAAPAR